jgi:hypothetical protein
LHWSNFGPFAIAKPANQARLLNLNAVLERQPENIPLLVPDIVIGEVLSTELSLIPRHGNAVPEGDGIPTTIVSIRVDRVLKGSLTVGETVRIRQYGAKGHQIENVDSDQLLVVGQRCRFILQPATGDNEVDYFLFPAHLGYVEIDSPAEEIAPIED